MRRQALGEFEELVLLAIGGLSGAAYTVSIQQRIEEKTGRSASMGAIYTALERLRKKGYVISWFSDVTPQPGGKRKRLYRVTTEGEEALLQARHARQRLWESLGLSPQ